LADQREAQSGQYSPAALEELVGPVALYPDDLLSIVLPASTYPLQIVQAARYLEEYTENPGLHPGEEWGDTIIALLNYPEVIELMNEDLDWTWGLGEAFIQQQTEVIGAVQAFRKRAYLAGHLKSDDLQVVSLVDGAIEIKPVELEVIYVPDYEPEQVVVDQTAVVYRYYPYARPVYYYPYPSHYVFAAGYFWGVTTVYRFGWPHYLLRVHHYGHRSHPYYGVRYDHRHTTRRTHPRRGDNSGNANRHLSRSNYRGAVWKAGNRHGARPMQSKNRDHRGGLSARNLHSPRAERDKAGWSHPDRSARRSSSAVSAETTRRALGIRSRTETRWGDSRATASRERDDRGEGARPRGNARDRGNVGSQKGSRKTRNMKGSRGRRSTKTKQYRSRLKTGDGTLSKTVNGNRGKYSKSRSKPGSVVAKANRRHKKHIQESVTRSQSITGC
jgi:hypothetical protein